MPDLTSIAPQQDRLVPNFLKALNKDASKIKQLIHQVQIEFGIQDDAHFSDSDLDDLERIYHQDNGYFGVVVGEDGALIGTYGLINKGDRVGEIRKMYIHKNHRGQGLGRKSLNQLIAFARERGYQRLEIETATVLKRALSLYEKSGFQYDDKKPDCSSKCDLIMYLDL